MQFDSLYGIHPGFEQKVMMQVAHFFLELSSPMHSNVDPEGAPTDPIQAGIISFRIHLDNSGMKCLVQLEVYALHKRFKGRLSLR